MSRTFRTSVYVGFLFLLFFSSPALAAGVQYTYDGLNRLTMAEYYAGTTVEYAYDAAGNRLSMTVVELLDSDGDGLPNTLENATCTNPVDPDTDNDGLSDGDEDADHDGVVDPGETDPCNADTDGDGLPDGWEIGNGTDPFVDDASDDPDTDTLTNLEEYNLGTDPYDSDTDGDGMSDDWEALYPGCLNPLVNDAGGDCDGDGRTNYQEYTAGSDPTDSAFYVPDDYATIQAALDGVPSGATIIVRDGTYSGSGNRNLDFKLKAATLRSENGPEACIIDCEGTNGRGFDFYSGESSSSVVDGFTITNGYIPTSWGGGVGGAIRFSSSSPTIKNCIISGSWAEDFGGALYCNNASPTISNCLIIGNSSYVGGGICAEYSSSSPIIENCTIVENSATWGGGIVTRDSGSATVINSILWGNTALVQFYGPQISLALSASLNVSYSDVEGGLADADVPGDCTLTWGTGNIDSDPLFVGGGDYHLTASSPCMNTATDAGVYDDIDWQIRPEGAGYDMGSDEFYNCADPLRYYEDADLDGYGNPAVELQSCTQPPGYVADDTDCNDGNTNVNPGEIETTCNGTDDDCNPLTQDDPNADGDPVSLCSGDCDDGDPTNYPGNTEICDGQDNDCDLSVDDADGDCTGLTTYYMDSDQDGHGVDGDTQDLCAPSFPYTATQGGDCHDDNANNYPGNTEMCDGQDNDCDDLVDANDPSCIGLISYYRDFDQDGYGVDGDAEDLCSPSLPYTAIHAGDCDDNNADNYPGNAEVCDGQDNDCDDLLDADDPSCTGLVTYYMDSDQDGYGVDGDTQDLCAPSFPYTATQGGDCHDDNANNYPGNTEVCDGQDNDCDDLVDANDPSCTGLVTYYMDSDQDGYGVDGDAQDLCSPSLPYTAIDAGDCDDSDPDNYPGNQEIDDGQDNDCDGLVDDNDPSCTGTWYEDADGDGYGNASVSLVQCLQPAGYVEDDTDCDDNDTDNHPGNTEVCDGQDNNCDDLVDDEDPDITGQTTWYEDLDGDSYGNPLVTLVQCAQPAGYVTDNTDCDDDYANVNPGVTEVCGDLIDNDCDGLTDAMDPECGSRTIYVDDSGICPGTGTIGDPFCEIQTAIDNSYGGDKIVVLDGIYTGLNNKNLDFGGRAITVSSQNGPANCIIDCEGSGRGFYFQNSETSASVVDGFTITNGDVAGNGGGIWCDSSSPTITNCIITGNVADFGGGIYCGNSSSPAITNCFISNNSSGSSGGGIWCVSSSPSLSNCVISNNTAVANGGGVYCWNSSSPSITNCTITGNAADFGGGIYCYESANPTATNCILWDDSAPSGPEIYITTSSSLTVSYSDVEGGQGAAEVDGTSTLTWGSGNIETDPLFVDDVGGDYHVEACSPGVDAGDPGSDYSNEPHPNGGNVNMGAYGNTPEATRAGCNYDAFFEAVPDVDGNGHYELVMQGVNPDNGKVLAQVWDAESAIRTTNVWYGPVFIPKAVGVLPDISGNGKSEIVMMGLNALNGKVLGHTRDAFLNTYIRYTWFGSSFIPMGLRVMGDISGNNKAEIIELGLHPDNNKGVAKVYDAFTGTLVKLVWYGPVFNTKGLVVLPDTNGNGKPDLVLLGLHPTNGKVLAHVRDSLTGAWIRYVWFGTDYHPLDLKCVGYVNNNWRPDLGLLGVDNTTGNTVVKVMDAYLKTTIRTTTFFSSGETPLAFEKLPDMDGNGKPELAVLAVDPSDGNVYVSVKDSFTGEAISTISYGSSREAFGLAWVPDINSNGYPELAVLTSDGGLPHAELRDASTGVLVTDITLGPTFHPWP